MLPWPPFAVSRLDDFFVDSGLSLQSCSWHPWVEPDVKGDGLTGLNSKICVTTLAICHSRWACQMDLLAGYHGGHSHLKAFTCLCCTGAQMLSQTLAIATSWKYLHSQQHSEVTQFCPLTTTSHLTIWIVPSYILYLLRQLFSLLAHKYSLWRGSASQKVLSKLQELAWRQSHSSNVACKEANIMRIPAIIWLFL